LHARRGQVETQFIAMFAHGQMGTISASAALYTTVATGHLPKVSSQNLAIHVGDKRRRFATDLPLARLAKAPDSYMALQQTLGSHSDDVIRLLSVSTYRHCVDAWAECSHL